MKLRQDKKMDYELENVIITRNDTHIAAHCTKVTKLIINQQYPCQIGEILKLTRIKILKLERL